MQLFHLKDEFIQLDQLLKACRIAVNGSHAHQLVDDRVVKLNGKTEIRRRAKIRKGDIVEVLGDEIKIE